MESPERLGAELSCWDWAQRPPGDIKLSMEGADRCRRPEWSRVEHRERDQDPGGVGFGGVQSGRSLSALEMAREGLLGFPFFFLKNQS